MPDNTLSKWVLHSDYARLKAENERLRKAGDDVFCIACNAPSSEGRQKILQAWRAAKEGKPSV